MVMVFYIMLIVISAIYLHITTGSQLWPDLDWKAKEQGRK